MDRRFCRCFVLVQMLATASPSMADESLVWDDADSTTVSELFRTPSDPIIPVSGCGEECLSLCERPGLLDGPGTVKDSLRKKGIDVQFSAVEFYQGEINSDAGRDPEFGSKLLSRMTFAGPAIGLWEGFVVSLTPEYNYGRNMNNAGGALLPVNTAMTFPADGESGGDLSLTLTQALSEDVSLTVGKFNMVQAAAATPLLGGGGIDTFMNVGLAAPITGLVPPYIAGAALNIKTDPALVSVMVYDPRSAQQQTGFNHWGENGVTTRVSATVPTQLFGLTSIHTVQGIYSSRTGFDLADIPQLILPPGSGAALGTQQGAHHVGYSVQQFLWQHPQRPTEGFGIFGQAGLSDDNPTPFHWMAVAGVAGTGVIPGRSLDRYGVGYFHYALSEELIDGLAILGADLGDESGVELFYNAAITPWLCLTGDVQVIDPGVQRADTVVLAGVRAELKL